MFKEKLKELRESKNISRKALARQLQVSRKLIVKWERGKSIPCNNNLKKICELFAVNEEILLNREEMQAELKKLDNQRKKVLLFVLGLILPIVFLLISLLPLFTYVGYCMWVQPSLSIFNILFRHNTFITILTISFYLYTFVFSFIYWNTNLKRGKLIQVINISLVVILFIITVIIVLNYASIIAYGPVILWD